MIIDLDSDLRRKVTFDTGRSVVIDRQIAEGGYGAVFVAHNATTSTTKKRKYDCDHSQQQEFYALKRIDCFDNKGNFDQNIVDRCKREAEIHSSLQHKDLMPLLGIQFDPPEKEMESRECNMSCYMLFPYLPTSLRDDISARRLLEDTEESNRRPYSEREALVLFDGIVDAVKTMHEAGISHRDIKVENILLRMSEHGSITPVLTDFGSAGPLSVSLRSRADVFRVDEDVAKHTTVEYRAPELFEAKMLEYGPSEFLDYGRADVWSLGCLLFALLYGSSPFEIEWGISFVGEPADGTARIVRCNKSLILGPIPFPPGGTAADRRYGEGIKDLIQCMLNHDRSERLSSSNVAGRVRRMLDGGENGRSD